MMKQISQTRITRPAQSPVDLNAGKPDPKEALFNAGLTMLFLVFGALGAWVSVAFGPHRGENLNPFDYGFVGYVRAVGTFLGWAVAGTALHFAWIYSDITKRGWRSYHDRLEAWNDAMLSAFDTAGGQETLENTNIIEIKPVLARDVLAVALCIHQEMKQDRTKREYEYPYSTRGLDRSLYLSSQGRGNQVLAGTLTGTRPEAVNAVFRQLGLVRGATPGYAGTWAPRNEGEVIELIAGNWHKLGRAYNVEEASEDDY
jgi:hypothetical protein